MDSRTQPDGEDGEEVNRLKIDDFFSKQGFHYFKK